MLTTAHVTEQIADHLDEIATMFSSTPKLTCIVRSPEVQGDAGILVTNDTFDGIFAEVERRRLAESGPPLRPAGWHGPVTEEQARAHPCWLVRIPGAAMKWLEVATSGSGREFVLAHERIPLEDVTDACAIDPHDGRWVEVPK